MSCSTTIPTKWLVCPVWSVFAVRLKKHSVLSFILSTQRRRWSDCADAQADLSLHWVLYDFLVLPCCGSNVVFDFCAAPGKSEISESLNALIYRLADLCNDRLYPFTNNVVSNISGVKAILEKLFVCCTPTLYFFGWVGRLEKILFAYFFLLHCCVMGKSWLSDENGPKKKYTFFQKCQTKFWVRGVKVGR